MTISEPTADLYTQADGLHEAFLRAGYTTDGVLRLLGDQAHDALGRGEPVPARRICAGGGELGVLIRLLLLGDTCSESEVAAALRPVSVNDAVRHGIVARDGRGLYAAIDLRPLDFGAGNRWLFSDLDGSLRRHSITEDHVLGVGHASLSLLRATTTEPVGRLLDVGTGCGVQAVHAADFAGHVTATDITDRSLALTRAGMAINGIDASRYSLLKGPWFGPVGGQKFDRIVANPPFVVGPPKVTHTYRDSGLDLDGASELMCRTAPKFLNEGGTASMLASWVITGDDWRERIAQWIPDDGVDAWVVQRDVADPALYVGTWLRDAGHDPRDPASAEMADRWLTHLQKAGVRGIGFGFVFLHRTDEPTDLLAEELSHTFEDPLGAEAADYLRRVAWLRNHDVGDERFSVADGVALEQVSTLSDEGGWEGVVTRIHRPDGPRWSHEIDQLGQSLLAGLNPDGLCLDEVTELLAVATGDERIDPAAVRELVEGLIRHGIVLPARWDQSSRKTSVHSQ
ncbi:UNVERIFIED_CONTAM: methyltransferase family protein [Williamsia faeni]